MARYVCWNPDTNLYRGEGHCRSDAVQKGVPNLQDAALFKVARKDHKQNRGWVYIPVIIAKGE